MDNWEWVTQLQTVLQQQQQLTAETNVAIIGMRMDTQRHRHRHGHTTARDTEPDPHWRGTETPRPVGAIFCSFVHSIALRHFRFFA